MRREEDRRRIGHFAQALFQHGEHAQLVHRAEAVLEGTQHTEPAARFALEIQHRVDHVLEHARTGDTAFLRHVADQEHRGAGFFRETSELGRGLAHLADRARRRREQFGPDGLDGVDDQHARTRGRGLLQDALDAGLRQRMQRPERQVEALGAAGDLGERLLARDIEARQRQAQRAQHLQKQGRLADPRIATNQHHGAIDEATAEHAIQFADAGERPRLGRQQHLGERRDFRRTCRTAGITATTRTSRRHHRASRLDDELGQHVPLAALGALALPFAVFGTALGADVGGLRLGHRKSRRSIERKLYTPPLSQEAIRPQLSSSTKRTRRVIPQVRS